jgi:DNA-binding Lrp family transcriptional regulator
LAAAVNVAPSTCLERVRGLRERGVITGYRAEIDLASVGRPVQAMISARIRPPNRRVIEGFRQFVCQLPEVLSVFVCSGHDDFLIHVAVRDVDHLNALVIDRLTERPELVDVRTSIVFEHLRAPLVEPIIDSGRPGTTGGGDPLLPR